jgi:putative tryptophan/tyrosine transport system substrate-binding protein
MRLNQVIRREFITLLGGAAAWPFAARAQQAERARRIGVLMPLAEDDQEARTLVTTFVKGMQDQGWAVGRNVSIDYRWAAGDAQRIQAFAKELVEQNSDLILARSSPVVAALMQQTRTIPIVFFQVVDPVGQGFVASLARPGGNVTGFTIYEPTIGSKWLELLKGIAPHVARVALVYNPDTAPFAGFFFGSITAAAPSVVRVPIRHPSGIESSIVNFAKEPNGGLIVLPDAFNLTNRELIVATAAQQRLPAIYPFRFFAASGGLMSYGIDPAEAMRQAAVYADRILKGVKPADLPVQAPTKFELVINLKTAKALRLDIPDRLLALADEVLE